MKTCTKCGETFPATLEYFYKDNYVSCGLSAWCKTCRKEYQKNYSKNNTEKAKYMKYYYKDNKDKFNMPMTDEEKIKRRKQYLSDFRKSDKGKALYKIYGKKHKKHRINKEEWVNCKKYFNNSCAYCGLTEKEHRKKYWNNDLHKEHVIDAGRNDLKNCVPSCMSCNSKKHEKSLNNWYNKNNLNYTHERYYNIYLWIRYDCKKYIKKKRRLKVCC